MRIEIRPMTVMVSLSVILLATAPAQQKPRPVPTLTSEDLITNQSASPGSRTTSENPKDQPLQPVGKSGATTKNNRGKDEAVSPQDKQKDEAQKAWSSKLREAEGQLRELERKADQAELEINQLRNLQFSATAKDADAGGRINVQIAELAERVRTCRNQAKQAESVVDSLKREGEEKSYKVVQETTLLPDGSPNTGYYQSRFAELRQDFNDAESRVQVVQLRINELTLRIRKNTGGLDGSGNATNSSDAFAVRRLKTALEEEKKKLAEALEKKEESARKIEDLRREAANAGVPEGDSR
jgi:chromosome segregation ATPase